MVDRLMAKGLISRKKAPEDKRIMLVSLEPAGEGQVQAVEEHSFDVITGNLTHFTAHGKMGSMHPNFNTKESTLESTMEKDSRLDILSYASIFEDDFSIDWVIEITGKKALEILSSELPDLPGKNHRLTTHLLKIQNQLSGCRLLLKEGNEQRKACRIDAAKKYYDKALEDLEHLSGKPADTLFMATALEYAKIWTTSQSYRSRIYVLLSLAHANFRLKKTKTSVKYLQKYLNLSKKTRFQVVQDPFLLETAWAMEQ